MVETHFILVHSWQRIFPVQKNRVFDTSIVIYHLWIINLITLDKNKKNIYKHTHFRHRKCECFHKIPLWLESIKKLKSYLYFHIILNIVKIIKVKYQFVSIGIVNVTEGEERSLRSSENKFFRLISNHCNDGVRLKWKKVHFKLNFVWTNSFVWFPIIVMMGSGWNSRKYIYKRKHILKSCSNKFFCLIPNHCDYRVGL